MHSYMIVLVLYRFSKPVLFLSEGIQGSAKIELITQNHTSMLIINSRQGAIKTRLVMNYTDCVTPTFHLWPICRL